MKNLMHAKQRFYKHFMCLSLLTAFVLSSSLNYAQTTVTIGSGTESNVNLPVYPYFVYSYSQQIVLQSEIDITGNITKIKFYMVGGIDLSNSNDWTIYLGHTTKSTFASNTDWEPLTNLTQVYTGIIDNMPVAGWYEITFDSPFSYNNINNLIVAVDENALGNETNVTYARTWSTPEPNRAMRFASDNTNPDPASPPTASARLAYINQMQFVICEPVSTLPYSEDFESESVPGLPECTSVENAGTGNIWATNYVEAALFEFNSNTLYYEYNETKPANTWFYTQGVELEAGTKYRLTFNYSGTGTYTEKLKVCYGTSAAYTSMSNLIVDYPNIINYVPISSTADFIPTTSGTYYIGFNCYSDANEYLLFVDDILLDKVACIEPINLFADNITATSANINWTENGTATAWNIIYGAPGFDPTSEGTTIAAGTNPFTITGLTENTEYDFYVQADCNSDGLSPIAGPLNLITPCGTANIPYSQDFNSVIVPGLPACTSVENVGAGNIWTTAKGSDYGFDSNMLKYEADALLAANTWFYTQEINLEAGTTYRLSFKYACAGYTEKLKVCYGTSAAHTSMSNLIVDYPNVTNTELITSTTDFTPSTTGTYYLGFKCYSDDNQFHLVVDDIVINFASCIEPTSLFADNITATSANINWTENGTATAWNIIYGAPGFDPTSEGTTIAAGTNPFTITGLTENTECDFYVQADCNSDGLSLSPIAGPESFTTQCVASSVPYTQNFESAIVPALPECTSVENAGTGNIWKTKNIEYHGFNSNVLFYNTHAFHDANAWFYTQAINLEAGISYRLTFKYGGSGYTEQLKVAYGTTDSHFNMTNNIIDYPSITGDTPNISTTDFTPTATGTYYIGLNCYSTASQNNLYVDNILIDISPACIEPTNLFADNITITSAKLNWTASLPAPANGYEIYYSTSATAPTESTTPSASVLAGVTTYEITDLTQNTNYYCWVRANCNDTDFSVWVGQHQFRTECDIITLPYNEDFESDSETIHCWTILDVDNDESTWNISTLDAYEGTQCVANYKNISGNNDWLISPKIDIDDDNYTLAFFAKSKSLFDLEDFSILISKTGNNPTDFTTTLENITNHPNAWIEHIYKLNEHGINSGDNIYIAIQHISINKNLLLIDAFQIKDFDAEPTKISTITKEGINIYPNPNNGQFKIDFNNIQGDVTYQVYDTKGSIIVQREIPTNGNTVEEVSVNLIPGIYFVKIVTTNQTFVKKLVIE